MRFFLYLKKYKKVVLLFLFCLFACSSFGYPFKPGYIITLFLLLMVSASLSSRLYQALVLLVCLISSSYVPIGWTYGPPDFNGVLAVFYSNRKEGTDFINAIPWVYYCCSLIGVLLTLTIFNFKIKRFKYRGLAITAVVLSMISTPVKLYFTTGEFNLASNGMPIIRVFSDTLINYRRVAEQNALLKLSLTTPDRWHPEVRASRYQLHILVIGESARRDFLHAYGFPVANTPFMSSAPGEIFAHYISAASSTQTSLKNSLALRQQGRIELNNNIITLARKAGFYTYWLSNQGSLGVHDTPVASIGKHADQSLFLRNGESDDAHYLPDTQLLPAIRSGIDDYRPRKLVVIHLIGSHPDACTRTDGRYEVFRKSKEISCYIESIKQTDQLLAQVAALANASGQTWSMMYFSDHGLSFDDANTPYARLSHHDNFKENYNIPLFITASDSQQRHINAQPRSAMNFLALFAEWMGIEDKLISGDCPMRADTPCGNQDTIIQFNGQTEAYSRLAEEKIAL